MRFKKEERDTLNFCAQSLSELASLKGNTEANARDYAKVLAGIVSGKGPSKVEASLVSLKPTYNKAADIVVAAIYNMTQGNVKAGLEMFATIMDAEDNTVLAQSLMQYNEAATEASKVESFAAPEDSAGFGETDEDYIDEDNDTLGPVGENDVSTMDNDEPLLGGEQDVLYFDPDKEGDSIVEDISADDDDVDDMDEIVMASLDTVDDHILQAAFEDEEEDIKPCSVDPVTDRKLAGKRPDKEKKPTHLYDKLEETEEKKVESRLLKVLSSKAFKSLDHETRVEITSTANKLSMSGELGDRKKALSFVVAAVNSF